MVTSSEDGTVKIWDTRSGTIQRNYIHGVPVNDVVIHPNQGEIISADRGGSVRIWDLGENKCTHELVPEPGCSVSSISIAGDGTIIAAGNNNVSFSIRECFECEQVLNILYFQGNVYLWHLAPSTSSPSSYLNGTSSSSSSSSSSSNQYTTITPLTSFQAHNAYITRVLLSPDTHHLATCSADHNARIWTVDLHVKERIRNPLNPALPALPHNPNLPLSTITNKTVTVEEMARQQRTQPYLHHSPNNPSINTQSSSPSSSSVLTAAATTPQTPPPFTTAAATAATNPANKALDAPFFLEATLDAHQRWVWDCAFSADSAYLVTSCSDHYARLWELGTRLVIRQYNGHHRGTVCVALNDFQEVRG